MDRRDSVLAKDPAIMAIAHPFMAPYAEALAGNGLAVTYALDETVAHDSMRVLACVANCPRASARGAAASRGSSPEADCHAYQL